MDNPKAGERPPFRIERVGERYELVHVVGTDEYRYGLSHYHVALLGRSVLDVLGGMLINTLVG